MLALLRKASGGMLVLHRRRSRPRLASPEELGRLHRDLCMHSDDCLITSSHVLDFSCHLVCKDHTSHSVHSCANLSPASVSNPSRFETCTCTESCLPSANSRYRGHALRQSSYPYCASTHTQLSPAPIPNFHNMWGTPGCQSLCGCLLCCAVHTPVLPDP